jgi:hypothetical protein
MNKDKQNVKLLSIFHYILGVVIALFFSIFLLHIASGISILCGPGSERPVQTFMGFIILPGSMMLCGWALAVCIFIAGSKLARYRARTYCLVIAGIECMFMPFGTVLGVFTIIVLMKDSVRELFETSRQFQQ